MSGVTTINVVDTAFPEEASTRKLATNGQNMSSAAAAAAPLAGIFVAAIAAGVEANIESGQRTRMRDALTSAGFGGEAVFDLALETALTEAEYELGTYESGREKRIELLELDADPTAEPGDAILDIAGVGYGYQLVGGNTQWRPFVVATVRLVDSLDPQTILMENQVHYNPVATSEAVVNIPPHEDYAFEDVKAIEANPQKASEGLELALEETAKAIANLLE